MENANVRADVSKASARRVLGVRGHGGSVQGRPRTCPRPSADMSLASADGRHHL